MVEAATTLALPYPEAAVVAEDTLADQVLVARVRAARAAAVLGGCCCSHIGAVEGLATRHERLAVVWIDAHGDLNTPETSPSGNEWGMPLRMILDGGAVEPADVALRRCARPRPAGASSSSSRAGCTPASDAVERALERRRCRLRRHRRRRARRGRGAVLDARPRRHLGGRRRSSSCAGSPRTRPVAGAGLPASSPTRANVEPPRGSAPARGPVTARPRGAGLRSRAYGGHPHRRLDRAEGVAPGRRRGPEAPEHLPVLRVPLPRRRARPAPRRLPAVRPPFPGRCARADRAARRSGTRSSRRKPTCAPPIRSGSSTSGRTRSGWPRPS